MNLNAIPGELRATIHVTRAATGKVDTFEIVGHADPEKLAQIIAAERGRVHHGATGAMVGEPGKMTNQPKEN